jgi:hypothetical protein
MGLQEIQSEDEGRHRDMGLKPMREPPEIQVIANPEAFRTGRRPVSRLTRLNKLQRLAAILLCLGIVSFNSACTVRVVPPVNPVNPTVVYLCDYGVHSSLLIPVAKGRYVEYLYGDWNWAALCHTKWWDALGAIFWSQQATLGRRFITQTADQKMPTTPDGPKTETAIIVNGDGCRKVLTEMAARWETDRAAHPDAASIVSDFWYVKDDQHYWWLHDCNLNTADSLAEMGCEIHGYAVWSKFDVQKNGATTTMAETHGVEKHPDLPAH